jgi:hypothetical protein
VEVSGNLNNYNLPSNIILLFLFSILLHVLASTIGHHQAFVHYINHKCTYICLVCELAITNLNFILCQFVKIIKSIKLLQLMVTCNYCVRNE